MRPRVLGPALIAALLVSCDDATVSGSRVGQEGYVSGPAEIGGIVTAVADKSLYYTMETAVESGDVPTPGSFYDEPWFALASGDRTRLLEVDVDQGIGRVEVLTGLCAGRTGWVSLLCVKHD
jgi:hypothetical protein